ncbi:DUF6414 family protein [Sporosarcina newyorkensis]|uniref:Uncharacterized protein n=1 Tax=Sporosarcina newyorkensis TaxID=759851 RepID=A0A1T4YIH1_9BACL|nr:DUF6414 family protein [Sporosarcina newyorkensis]SKB01338.1 hypothetical protein SAMN04244570_2687 [Sporosarcina newyorkensis]
MKDILKLAYFDEQAAVDFLEIKESGSSSEIMKVVTEKNKDLGFSAEAGKVFFSFLKFGLSGNMNKKNNSIIETQVTRTIYNKFIELSKEAKEIKKYKHINLKIVKNSATYFRNLMPFIKMIDDTGEFENAKELKGLNHQELDTIFDDARGYYEYLGEIVSDEEEYETVIIRFNINGMRNNYSLYDLTKMNLSIYGIEVGKAENIDLNFMNEMNEMLQEEKTKPKQLSYEEMKSVTLDDNQPTEQNPKSEKYKIIDVIVAGI